MTNRGPTPNNAFGPTPNNAFRFGIARGSSQLVKGFSKKADKI